MTPEELREIAEKEAEAAAAPGETLRVCTGSSCLSAGADKIKDELKKQAASFSGKPCRVKGVGCMGLCASGPLVQLGRRGPLYKGAAADDSADILKSVGGRPVERLVCPTDTPFFTRQLRVVREQCGVIDPERIEDSIAAEGYLGLQKALTQMTPAEVIAEVTASGLRGRGGAGFPTGLKWNTVAKAASEVKYVVCNGDEGDPGAFMDRSMLESDPHRVLEGMAIAAYAVGASKGYLYVRAEYPLAVKRLQLAIRQAERLGLLGADVFGTHFSFTLQLRIGAGAFVCGEETALMASIEGRRGMPRVRPPFPAQSGLWRKPTLLNNVKSFANVPGIVRKGGAWFAAMGTEKSKGTGVFALAGKVRNIGLIEVPMGVTLREIVFDIGGGIPDGRKFKAVQTGGPSGGCVPEQFLDMPLDYESLAKVGSIMGSGGMIVMDDTSCMVDVARFFMDFCRAESCGKCVPCRVGTTQMLRVLTRITRGEGAPEDVARLEELCDLVKSTSLCGLGMSAPNPVLTTLKYFRDEYDAHIREKRCPAGRCKIAQEAAA